MYFDPGPSLNEAFEKDERLDQASFIFFERIIFALIALIFSLLTYITFFK